MSNDYTYGSGVISGPKGSFSDGFVIPTGTVVVETDGGVKIGRDKPYGETRYLATSHECDETTHHWHHPFFSHRWLRWLSYGLLFHLALHLFFEIAFHISLHTFANDWLDFLPGFGEDLHTEVIVVNPTTD